jgi:predicted DNA-binding antitoxin AbrB/MazE fold protein
MEGTLEAVYQNGVFVPLGPIDLPDTQHVKITFRAISPPTPESVQAVLAAWQAIFADLPESDVAEIEQIALDRSRFMDLPDDKANGNGVTS